MDVIRQFKALSDPTRLRLLHILNEVELNVNEIVSIVDMIQSGVSRHLKILLESGLLAARKEGSFMYYCADTHSENRSLIQLACARIQADPVCRLDLEKARQIIMIRKNRTKRFFSTVAPQWEGLKKEILGSFNLNEVLKERMTGRQSIADLGCGTGELLGYLVQDTPRALIGVDASPEMLEQARIKLPGLRSIELRLGEVEYLPMKDQEVDTVVMSMVLYHIFQPEKAIHEVFRVLKPGGLFFLADFKHHDQEEIKDIIGGTWLGFEKTQVKAWLAQSGFHLQSLDRYAVERGLHIHLFAAKK
ncbi:MAG: metalloregulator ArsR/SmtB family transcription factor [Desulfotignum sp.]|nr:metalloregulator ArsR/SmtB family transcription factor [Desulfotignum sp.]MCF8113281.1 metalloregulator ArsR/SmtB family transcription factor [Desulfotignum sp.]MCF8125389.1 metalloregulator ArsR/SmtB family transcription factor [Desulfotignum sp.]